MGHLYLPGVDAEGFFKRAIPQGYSMEASLIDPQLATAVSRDLARNGFLKDMVELEPVACFNDYGMKACEELCTTLNESIISTTGIVDHHLTTFSVRVFEPGKLATDIHRNHWTVGPWAVGITLTGESPFNIYGQPQLPKTIDRIVLTGEPSDPEPIDSMVMKPGSAWTLYTAEQSMPHSGGVVESEDRRELLILYGRQWDTIN